MGASSSTVTAGIKNQVDGKKNHLYKLADVTGNGVLAVLAKEVLKSGKFELLDIQIKEVNFFFFLINFILLEYCSYVI